MASADAWFLPLEGPSFEHILHGKHHGKAAYFSWPSGLKATRSFIELQARLARNEERGCSVEVFDLENTFSRAESNEQPKWKKSALCRTENELLKAIVDRKARRRQSSLYVVSGISIEATQILGYYFDLTPRIFSSEYSALTTGPLNSKYMVLGLQFMEKYYDGHTPLEEKKSSKANRICFDKKDPRKPTWRYTRIAITCMKSVAKDGFDTIIHADPDDLCLLASLGHLVQNNDQGSFSSRDDYSPNGPHQVVNEFFFLVSYQWNALLQEAEEHLQGIGTEIMQRNTETYSDTDIEKIIGYTQELHELAPLWVSIRRHILFATHAIEHVLEHPLFQENISPAFHGFLAKRSKVLDDQMQRARELTEETNVLISLILNLTNLRDARHAMKQNQYSIDMQKSIQRVTVLTFIYLPLTFISSCFGMNVSEINGSAPPVWAYVVVAIGFTSITLCVLYGWSSLSKSKQLFMRSKPEREIDETYLTAFHAKAP